MKWLFILVPLMSSIGCSSLLYAPTNGLYVHPKRLDLSFEEIQFKSDSHTLFGWYFKQTAFKKPKGFLLFFHGNGQNRSSHYLSLAWMLEKGYDYFIFDYQGYGESEGKATPEHTVDDGISALKWFFRNAKLDYYQDVPLIVFAQSLGGAIALRSLEDYESKTGEKIPPSLKWVVLDSSFQSYQKAGASLLSKHWFTFLFQPMSYVLLSDEYAPKHELEKLPQAKYLVMHGDQDQLVDLKLGRALFEALPREKKWILIEGGNHIDAFHTHEGRYREEFLKTIGN